MKRSPHIESYGLIGDTQTAAHVCDDGSVNWLCLPRFDSPAVLAALLGTEKNGTWRISPDPADRTVPATTSNRQYSGHSLVLESDWETPTGVARVIDFMPPREGTPQVIRIVQGVAGRVKMVSTLRPKPGYGHVTPWIYEHSGRVIAVAGADALTLETSVPQTHANGAIMSSFTITEGDSIAFVLSWSPSHEIPVEASDPNTALTATLEFWEDWMRQCSYDGSHREAVFRSLITLKSMTYGPTGGIVAAPTTSLPEEIGGERNWDYRYTWLRDASTTLASLLGTGYRKEAQEWHNWLLRAVAGDPEHLQVVYGIAGERELPERELPWLRGYENSTPVRTGNGAAGQLQLDVYGEVIETLYLAHREHVTSRGETASLHQQLIEHLATRWREPDEGIWEIRGPRRHFVHSKVMAWVAVDRTIRLAQKGFLDVDVSALSELRETIHHEVCTRGFDAERNTFTQFYGSTDLDAALLLIPRVGFLPPDDARVVGTVEAVQRELSMPEGLLKRYPTAGEDAGVDGLQGDEGAFVLCSFWLVDALALIGRVDEANTLFEHLLSLRTDLGLLAEQYDPASRRQLGNFPQAFSHTGLIDSALLLQRLHSRAPTPSIASS